MVALTGEEGIGKTRLAAELAAEVHEAGGSVLYASGWARPEAVAAALRRARQARVPTLLVVDDAEAGPGVVEGLVEAAAELSGKPVLVLATAGDGIGGGIVESLALPPLDRTAVHRIAQLYAPHGAVPVGEILAASRGLPGRVHELASEWALQAATRRVEAFAPRAAAGRSELRSAEHELAGGVVALQVARERLDRLDDGARVVCPFKGLASFDVADAPYFFGRERLVAELVARAVGAPLLGVVGPSGSGKSSVVKAGPAGEPDRRRAPRERRLAAGRHQAGRAPDARAARRGRSLDRAGRRSVRGDLHRLPGRERARGVRRRSGGQGPDRRRPGGRRPASRFLRALRGVSPSCRGCSAPTRCWWAR